MIRKPKRYIIKNLNQLKDDRGRHRRSKTRTVRHKKKAVPQSSAAQSDIKLFTALRKLGLTNIPGIKEVNFYLRKIVRLSISPILKYKRLLPRTHISFLVLLRRSLCRSSYLRLSVSWALITCLCFRTSLLHRGHKFLVSLSKKRTMMFLTWLRETLRKFQKIDLFARTIPN